MNIKRAAIVPILSLGLLFNAYAQQKPNQDNQIPEATPSPESSAGGDFLSAEKIREWRIKHFSEEARKAALGLIILQDWIDGVASAVNKRDVFHGHVLDSNVCGSVKTVFDSKIAHDKLMDAQTGLDELTKLGAIDRNVALKNKRIAFNYYKDITWKLGGVKDECDLRYGA